MVNTPGIAPGSSPYVSGYNGGTPIATSSYMDNFRSYSPAGAAGGGSNHAYSPTGLNIPYQSPAYSPTTPNYAIQQQTNTYAYGGPSANAQPTIMPTISSPSHSPATRNQAAAGGVNAPYAIGGAYGGSPSGMYPASPMYNATIGTTGGRPLGQQATQPAAGSKPAYDPAMAGGADAAQNSEDDSDD